MQSFDTYYHKYCTMDQDTSRSGGQARVLKLNDEQKRNLEAMAEPSQMEPGERKRQYAALRRAIHKSCEPALLAKFQLSNDGERCGLKHQNLQFDPQNIMQISNLSLVL